MLAILEWAGPIFGVVSSRCAWPIWIRSNACLIAYFLPIHSWGVLGMQAIYLHSSVRGFGKAFPGPLPQGVRDALIALAGLAMRIMAKVRDGLHRALNIGYRVKHTGVDDDRNWTENSQTE